MSMALNKLLTSTCQFPCQNESKERNHRLYKGKGSKSDLINDRRIFIVTILRSILNSMVEKALVIHRWELGKEKNCKWDHI